MDYELKKAGQYASRNKQMKIVTINYSNNSVPSIQPRAMYGKVSGWSDSVALSTDIFTSGYIVIRTHATFDADIQRNNIIKAYRPTLDARQAVTYDDYVKLLSYTVSINNSSSNMSKRYAQYNIKCEVKKSIAIGGTEAWAKEEQNYSTKIYPFK